MKPTLTPVPDGFVRVITLAEDYRRAVRRIATLEARLARVLGFSEYVDDGQGVIVRRRGRVWSRKRAGGGR